MSTAHHYRPFTVRSLETGVQAGSRFKTEPEALGFLHLVMNRHPGEAYAVYRDELMVTQPQARHFDREVDLLRRIAEALEHIEDAITERGNFWSNSASSKIRSSTTTGSARNEPSSPSPPSTDG